MAREHCDRRNIKSETLYKYLIVYQRGHLIKINMNNLLAAAAGRLSCMDFSFVINNYYIEQTSQ